VSIPNCAIHLAELLPYSILRNPDFPPISTWVIDFAWSQSCEFKLTLFAPLALNLDFRKW
jgi:hypothetical protein